MLCRLGLHRWEAEVRADNTSFQRCARCGKERDMPSAGSPSHPGSSSGEPPVLGPGQEPLSG